MEAASYRDQADAAAILKKLKCLEQGLLTFSIGHSSPAAILNPLSGRC